MNLPIISFIVPVYNAERYLDRMVESIRCQTLSNWELIFIDDFSADSSREKITEYASYDNRIKYIFLDENGGPAIARNLGIDSAHGEFISFIDADDFIATNFAEMLISYALKYDADIVWCQYIEVINGKEVPRDNKLSREAIYEREEALKLFFHQICGLGSLWNKIYRRDFISSNILRINENRTRAEDWEFNLNAFQRVGRLKIVSDNLYYYVRGNNNSIMSSFREKDFDLMCSSSSLLKEINDKYKLGIVSGFDDDSNALFFIEYMLRAVNVLDMEANRILSKVLNSLKFRQVMHDCTPSSLPTSYRIIRLLSATNNVWAVKNICRFINRL